MTRLLAFLGLFSVLSSVVFYFAGVDIVNSLSPQGCRMSWMSPSYILQSGLNESWTPLAKRYSLWLYREVGWETSELLGLPVLFIPGNAGSSHQVRSIGSSATRQYYTAPYQISPEFQNTDLKPLDFYALEFNEDLSAFHGPTLDAERAYAAAAIAYILARYPPGTPLAVLGHSMGGLVATALLPHANISAVLTMSTPHALPPARFDRRVDALYAETRASLAGDPTPILSLCGGATDLMIPSESCIIEEETGDDAPYRRTVFTSALEGCWTGVGHREMVWCHQVRWRVARALLALQSASGPAERGAVLDHWLRDGRVPPPVLPLPEPFELRSIVDGVTVLPRYERLTVRETQGAQTYALHAPAQGTFVLYARGSVLGVGPHAPTPLAVSVFLCPRDRRAARDECLAMKPTVLRLVPVPVLGKPFPVPEEGVDEGDGAVMFVGEVPPGHMGRLVVVKTEGSGWVVAGFEEAEPIVVEAGMAAALFQEIRIDLPAGALYKQITLPNLLPSSLIVYRITPSFPAQSICTDALLPPLLRHTAPSDNPAPSESHYHALRSARPILLHAHASGPHIARSARGFALAVHASSEAECGPDALELRVDWWATFGRWGVRYAGAAASWAVGVVALVVFHAWGVARDSGRTPGVAASLGHFARRWLPWLVGASLAVSLVPLPAGLWLGNQGEPVLSVLAPLLLLITTGLVTVLWGLLSLLLLPLRAILGRSTKPREERIATRTALLSMGLVCLLILLVVPWQVAFLGCFVYHLWTCATRHDDTTESEHLLLLMAWLLPLAAPVLAVWVRTLATAGLTAPWTADHNVLCVAPFLLAVEGATVGGALFPADAGGLAGLPRWGMLLLAAVAFLVGPRSTYLVFEVASGVFGVVVVMKLRTWYGSGMFTAR